MCCTPSPGAPALASMLLCDAVAVCCPSVSRSLGAHASLGVQRLSKILVDSPVNQGPRPVSVGVLPALLPGQKHKKRKDNNKQFSIVMNAIIDTGRTRTLLAKTRRRPVFISLPEWVKKYIKSGDGVAAAVPQGCRRRRVGC